MRYAVHVPLGEDGSDDDGNALSETSTLPGGLWGLDRIDQRDLHAADA